MQDSTHTTIANDTLKTAPPKADTVPLAPAKPVTRDTLTAVQEVKPIAAPADTTPAQTVSLAPVKPQKPATPIARAERVPSPKPAPTDSTIQKTDTPAVALFTPFAHRDTLFNYPEVPLWKTRSKLYTTQNPGIGILHEFQRSQLNWTLLIGLLCAVLLLTLRLYYNKFISQVFNTLVNFQLADTLLREKNVITRRAFFMLNIIYILIFSIFIQLLVLHFHFPFGGSHLKSYLIIVGGLTGIILVRVFIYYIVGYIFEWLPIVAQQLHINFLVNKNIGLVLFPLVFASIYSAAPLSGIVLYFALSLLFLGTLYKIIRGFQIILRNGVLLFYAIVYLCTLEILPLVVASKLILLLR